MDHPCNAFQSEWLQAATKNRLHGPSPSRLLRVRLATGLQVPEEKNGTPWMVFRAISEVKEHPAQHSISWESPIFVVPAGFMIPLFLAIGH